MASSTKLRIATHDPWIKTTALGLWNLLLGAGSHLGPLLSIFLAICWQPFASPAARKGVVESVRLIQVALFAMTAILIAGVVLFKVTGFKDRWLMPLCVWVPILLVAQFSARLNTKRIERLAWIAALIGLFVSVLIPTRVWLASSFRFVQALNMPFDKLSEKLPRTGATNHLFIAGDNWVGGNLKSSFPEAFVVTPQIHLQLQRSGAEALLVWNATKNEALPPKLFQFASRFAEVNTNQTGYVEAPMKFYPDKTAKLGFLPCRLKADRALVLGSGQL